MTAQLHPAVAHHVANTLGWPSLRPLQQAAIEPISAGEHAVMLAPTAGGKTEAATFPLLSRMLTEEWDGLTVLYVCPLKALLNNLAPRLEQYASLVGRRAALWHGDVPPGARARILAEPPDLLLTTPESLEVMLISPRIDSRVMFGRLRTIVIDEVHAFAGDDRGWHLLALLERLQVIAGRRVQRIGLSATVGEPDRLLDWLRGSDNDTPGQVLAPTAEAATSDTDVTVDHVGSLANAATVISRLHRGEKRLVFADSRARVEELATELRARDVTTFVSHSSLSLDERRQAEQAFAEARDCVIAATSTLELGIDVGDLDRVIQIDAPTTVASFLQRIGRTGRRPGSSRNCLFLCLDQDAVLLATGLLRLWEAGWVEPVTPPPAPVHLLSQQLMALTLQEGQIGRHLWQEWIGDLPPFAALPDGEIDAVLDHLLTSGLLTDEAGLLSMGAEGEESYGRRHFLDLISVFTGEPLFTVWHGRRELGKVDPISFQRRQDGPAVILLGGRAWAVKSVDFGRRQAFVEPTDDRGKSRWGSGARALSYELCQSMAAVLGGGELSVAKLSGRGFRALNGVREEQPWADANQTTVAGQGERLRWWTFAGLRANLSLAAALDIAGPLGSVTNLSIPLTGTHPAALMAIRALSKRSSIPAPTASPTALKGLKFSDCLPDDLALRTLSERMADPAAVSAVLASPVSSVTLDR